MTLRRFLLQGVQDATHADAVGRVFAADAIERGLISVAFVTRGGVDLIAGALAPHADRTTVFAGIRNPITSIQGMRALRGLGVRLYAVDTASPRIVFHPKVYAASGGARARVVVGSANLTRGGLGGNVEASIVADLDLTAAADAAFLKEVSDALLGMPTAHPEHVIAVTSDEQLQEMFEQGRLIDEALPPPPPIIGPRGGAKREGSALKPIKLRTAAPGRPKVPPVAPPPPQADEVGGDETAPPVGAAGEFVPVWESDPLTNRDLNIKQAGTSTNPTGSMGLKRGRLPKEVNFRRYFRDNVLAALPWATHPKEAGKETTTGRFTFVIRGVNKGTLALSITHDNRTNTVMYQQNQFMTTLHWGQARALVADAGLLERTLTLYRGAADPTRFLIEID
jgi:hypothetical protein